MRQETIDSLRGRLIINSRGDWTVEAVLNGKWYDSAPSGASVGANEAVAIPAQKAVYMINTKLQQLTSMEINQAAVDVRLKQIDGTPNFSKIGANTAIAVSSAVYRAAHGDEPKNLVFPRPLVNILGGGKHGGSFDIQEILVAAPKARTYADALGACIAAWKDLRAELRKRGLVGMNDEGALVADIDETKAFGLVRDVARAHRLKIGADFAASSIFDKSTKMYNHKKAGKKLSRQEQADLVRLLIKENRLFYAEDPLHEEDFDGFAALQKKVRGCMIAGDDLTVTSRERIQAAAAKRAVRAVIIKPNQVGTMTQTKEAVEMARKKKIVPVISHRSGETSDSLIARLALDWRLPLIKAGIADLQTKHTKLLRWWDEAERTGARPRLATFRT